MHHLPCGISSPLHSVNLVRFTLLLVHLILRFSFFFYFFGLDYVC